MGSSVKMADFEDGSARKVDPEKGYLTLFLRLGSRAGDGQIRRPSLHIYIIHTYLGYICIKHQCIYVQIVH